MVYLNSFFNHQASQGEEEVNLLRQEVNNLKARLQKAGSPRRESPGVGAGAEDQVAEVDVKSVENNLPRFLLQHRKFEIVPEDTHKSVVVNLIPLPKTFAVSLFFNFFFSQNLTSHSPCYTICLQIRGDYQAASLKSRPLSEVGTYANRFYLLRC